MLIGDRKDFKFRYTGWMCKSQPTDDKLSLIGAWSGHVTHYILGGYNHITGTAEPIVVSNFVHR